MKTPFLPLLATVVVASAAPVARPCEAQPARAARSDTLVLSLDAAVERALRAGDRIHAIGPGAHAHVPHRKEKDRMRRSLVIAVAALAASAGGTLHAQGSGVMTHSSCATAMGAAGVAAPRSTGRVPSWTRGVLIVVEGFWTWYRRNWRATVISNFLQPVLFLLAMGIGFGSQVRQGEATGGHPYLVYLAPALLVITAAQNAMFESTWAVFSSFKWQRTYLAMVST